MGTFEDYSTAARMRDLFETTARGVLNRERPAPSYGTVQSIDKVNNECMVLFPGDPQAVPIPMGLLRPSWPGQEVRVEGLIGDRYISDVRNPNFAPQPEPWQLVGPGLAIPFQNSWTSLAGFDPVGFTKDAYGIVWLKGVITGGTNNSVAFTLPPGYAPGVKLNFAEWSNLNNVAGVTVAANGTVTVSFLGTNIVILDGIKFPAASVLTLTVNDGNLRMPGRWENAWTTNDNGAGGDPLTSIWRRPDGWCLGIGNARSGTVSSAMFVLPEDTRPMQTEVLTGVSHNGTSILMTRIDVTVVGLLSEIGGGNVYCSIAGLDWCALNTEDGRWTQLPLQNAWTQYDTSSIYNGGFCYPSYWMDPYGICHVRGLIKAGTIAQGTVIGQLPQEMAPGGKRGFTTLSNGGSALFNITSQGQIVTDQIPSNAWVGLHATYIP